MIREHHYNHSAMEKITICSVCDQGVQTTTLEGVFVLNDECYCHRCALSAALRVSRVTIRPYLVTVEEWHIEVVAGAFELLGIDELDVLSMFSHLNLSKQS